MTTLRLSPHPDGTVVEVWVQPRSRRPGITGLRDGALHLRVAAPPEDGRANAEVCRLLAETLGIRARDVRVVAGDRSRTKQVLITAMAPAELSRRLATSGDA